MTDDSAALRLLRADLDACWHTISPSSTEGADTSPPG